MEYLITRRCNIINNKFHILVDVMEPKYTYLTQEFDGTDALNAVIFTVSLSTDINFTYIKHICNKLTHIRVKLLYRGTIYMKLSFV